MLVIPCRQATLIGVVAKFNLSYCQRVSIRQSEDRYEHAAPSAIGQLLPVYVERTGMRGCLSPFQDIEPPGIVRKMHANMVGNEIENEAQVILLQRRAEARKSR